jgi:type IV pilus assembly protein PilV
MQVFSRQRGVSLIEVMMAVLIFSVGLIGLASLMVVATRSNQAAYLRTQVTFLASSMADRMRANPAGLWNGAYNSAAYPIAGTTDCETVACSPTDIAKRDQQAWSTLLITLLPNAKAGVTCTAKDSLSYSGMSNDQLNRRPPYGGTCAMTISWSERNAGDKDHSDAALQTFAWEFQP